MKIKKLQTLNEAVAKISDTDQGVVGIVFADAVREAAAKKEKIEKAMVDRKIEMPNEDRFAHKKVDSTKEMKKMKLAESLFTEWFDADEEKETFIQPNLILEEGQYQFDDETGNITVNKAIFDDYMEGKKLNVKFVDEEGEDIFCYKMISENDDSITMEYVSEGIPGIDEEVADCQKYPVEKPEAKDSQFISADDKQPKDLEKAKDTGFISAEDKQPNKAAMTEDFINWDSPESRIERYETDLPELMATMHDNYMQGRVAAEDYAQALKIAYDALDSVPQIDEALEDSQRYPIEKAKAKDSQFISKEDKQPTIGDAKDSQFISAGDKDVEKAFGEKKLGESLLAEEAIYKYKAEREPLGEIIQVELTEGEWGYREENGKQTATRLPSANYRDDKIGANWDRDDRYAITVLGSDAEQLQSAIDIATKYNKEYKIEKLSKPIAGDTVRLWIYMDEDKDFDDPYKGESDIVDMNKAPKKVIYDNISDSSDDDLAEAIESEQKFPVESPISEELEPLNEITVFAEGLANFEPVGLVAEQTWAKINGSNKIATLEFMLEDMYPNGISQSELNALLENDSKWVLDMLNISGEQSIEATKMPDGNLPANEIDDDFGFND